MGLLINEVWKNKSLIVISGPSGCGKSTILKRILARNPGRFGYSVSHTTRSIREGEIQGKEYHFVTKAEFKSLIHKEKFIEYTQYSGNYYGTSKEAIQSVIQDKKICILEIDLQGILQLKEKNIPAKYIFIRPPSLDELERRLRRRKTEQEEAIEKRLLHAEKELEYSEKSGFHDLIIVNDDLNKACETVEKFCLDVS